MWYFKIFQPLLKPINLFSHFIIKFTGRDWIVSSQPGKAMHEVVNDGKEQYSTHPNYERRGLKYIHTLVYTIKNESDQENNTTTITKMVWIVFCRRKIHYFQDLAKRLSLHKVLPMGYFMRKALAL